jgi:hypothetical protein
MNKGPNRIINKKLCRTAYKDSCHEETKNVPDGKKTKGTGRRIKMRTEIQPAKSEMAEQYRQQPYAQPKIGKMGYIMYTTEIYTAGAG